VFLPLGSLIYKAGSLVEQTDAGYDRGWSAWKALQITLQSPLDHASEFKWSLLTAVSTMAATLLVAAPLAHAARRRRIAAALALSLAVAGLALPGPLIGLGLISIFNDPSWPWLNRLYDRTIGVMVIAQSIRAFPIAFFILWAAIITIPRSQIEQSWVDGAGPLIRFLHTLRQRPLAIVLAALSAFVVSLGELGATILVTAPGIVPLSVRIFGLLHYNVEDQVAGITLMLIALFAAASCLLAAGVSRLSAWGKADSFQL
jgi:iron(III) transport system permease protein